MSDREESGWWVFPVLLGAVWFGWLGYMIGSGHEERKARIWAVERGYAQWIVNKEGHVDWVPNK